MTISSYTSDELKNLRRTLEQIIEEAKSLSLSMDVDAITERMFKLDDLGERDPEKLRAAILDRVA